MSANCPETVPPASPIAAGPQALELAVSMPRTYGLDHRLSLLSVSALPIPQATLADAPLGGAASVWPFPAPLQARARAGVATPYDVVLAEGPPDRAAPPHTLANVTWVTLLNLKLRPLEGIAHQYELAETDADDRGLLRDLWRHLATTNAPGTFARLLAHRACGTDGAACLEELATDPALTFIVKTRATAGAAADRPGRPLDAGQPGSCFASFDDLASWLRLLCEARAVDGRGYCFGFTGSDGGDLPASARDADGSVTLTLLVIVGEQQTSALAAGRPLLPFNNAALVGPGLDAATKALSVAAADASDMALIARVPPGHEGFSLPDPEQAPCRGRGSSAVMGLDFADPPGHASASPRPVGYTDPLRDIADCPGVATSFTLQPAQDGAHIRITIAAQASSLQPRPGQAHDDFTDSARRLAEHFAAIHFQLAQPELSLSVVTSLHQGGSGAAEPLALDGLAPLRAFAAAAYVAATAASNLQPVRPFAAAPGMLGSVHDLYGPSWVEIAQANATASVVALLGAQALTMPLYIAFAAGDTANGLIARAPVHWPALTADALLLCNAELPLRAGAVLAVPAAIVPVTGEESLDALAEQHHTTAALLAGDCCKTSGVLRSGFVFGMGGASVTVGSTPAGWAQPIGTLDDVCRAFAAQGVNDSLGAIAARNGSQVGMFAPGAQLNTLHYVSRAASAGRPADSLARNASGAGLADLAALNGSTTDLFELGTSLYWGSLQSPAPPEGEPASLHAFAERHDVTAAQLLQANAALQVPAGSALQVPAAVSLPGDAARIRVPYTVQAGDSLAGVAAAFMAEPGTQDAAMRLAAANLAMPGTVAAGAITVAGIQVEAQAGDSLGAVLARLQVRSSVITLADLVAAIGTTSGHLASGGLLICPPALLPGSAPMTPRKAASLYGVDVVSFAQANAGILGLIAPDVPLHLSRHDTPQGRLTTSDRDTFNSLAWRFAAQGVAIGLAELVADLQDSAFLKAGARALLPPATAVLDTAAAVGAGPFASAAFPLSVAVRLQRPGDAMDPAFRTGCGEGRSSGPSPSSPRRARCAWARRSMSVCPR